MVFILNLLTEIEFFRNIEVKISLPLYLSILNSPSLIFEMFPFIFLLATQVFFINLFKDNQIQIFKYSGLKNNIMISILSCLSLMLGVLIILIFYNFSSNFKNLYLELKNKYSADDKYLAVITKNGLWIKDRIDGKINIINSLKIDDNSLVNTFISQFDENYDLLKNIYSEKINIENKNWIARDIKIIENNVSYKKKEMIFKSNFDYEKIQSLFSNLSSLSLIELVDLNKNYDALNYSTTEVKLQIYKIVSYPIYLMLMTILSSIIMFNTRHFTSTTFKISVGIFSSVIIYYLNNFLMLWEKQKKFPWYHLFLYHY